MEEVKKPTTKKKIEKKSSFEKDDDWFYKGEQTPSTPPQHAASKIIMIGECYISFQKLLSQEMRTADRRDSFIIDEALKRHTSTDGAHAVPSTPPALKQNSPKGGKGKLKRFKEVVWNIGQ